MLGRGGYIHFSAALAAHDPRSTRPLEMMNAPPPPHPPLPPRASFPLFAGETVASDAVLSAVGPPTRPLRRVRDPLRRVRGPLRRGPLDATARDVQQQPQTGAARRRHKRRSFLGQRARCGIAAGRAGFGSPAEEAERDRDAHVPVQVGVPGQRHRCGHRPFPLRCLPSCLPAACLPACFRVARVCSSVGFDARLTRVCAVRRGGMASPPAVQAALEVPRRLGFVESAFSRCARRVAWGVGGW